MGLIGAIAASASGLAAQRVRMDVVSSNVANIDTTRHRRRRALPPQGRALRLWRRRAARSRNVVPPFHRRWQTASCSPRWPKTRSRPARTVYDPSHPDADAETGMLEMPNVDLVQEMTDLTSANRSYQANVTVLNAVKQMALRALDISSR